MEGTQGGERGVPEHFERALREGRPWDIADADADAPGALLYRGIARIALGRDREARSDLESCVAEIGDPARIELALLEARKPDHIDDGLAIARAIMDRTPTGTPLHARACHVVGWAEGKRRLSGPAFDALDRARETYLRLNARRELGEVYDTMGEVSLAQGQLESALSYYAMSLVEKTTGNDRLGMALTIGNIGRANLRMGRYQNALEAFMVDLRLSRENGDRKGVARMLEDIGRARMALGEYESAEKSFREAEEKSGVEGFEDLQFFALKDLSLCLMALDRLEEAARVLDRAEELLTDSGSSYLTALLLAARGALAERRNDPAAIDLLNDAIQQLLRLRVPDYEIPTRVVLSRALVQQGHHLEAERCLSEALEVSRSRGYARYLPVLREEMKALSLEEGAVDERGRRLAPRGQSRENTDYEVIRSLGRPGAFGEVYLVFDVLHDRRVAYKRLRLDHEYDGAKRRRLLTSIRVELDAASHIRHPGVARVLAIGEDDEGNAYVVQEFVDGEPLSAQMRGSTARDPRDILPIVRRVAGALEALHEESIIHRDLKPSNIMIRSSNRTPVLIDFGIAQTPPRSDQPPSPAVAGSPPYMAKEQLDGHASAKSDVFALGATLFEWLTGEHPRPLVDGNPWHDAVQQPAVPIETLRSDLTPPLVELVNDMLELEPRLRPSTAEVQRRCDEILHNLPPDASVGSTWKVPDDPS